MKRTATIRIAALLLLTGLLGPAALAGRGDVYLDLPDGRKVPGTRITRSGSFVTLTTAFGQLRVPRTLIDVSRPKVLRHAPKERYERRTNWFRIDCDLTAERAALYANELDAYFEWLIGIYGMDRKRLKKRAPFPVHVYRMRADFKRVQDEVAPGISESKGSGFAEGVAGFHSGKGTYLWDAEGAHGGTHLEVGKHEVTHLLNSHFASMTGVRFPVWFEEGTATYFEAAVSFGGREPEDNPAALATVLGDLSSGRAYANRALRGVPYSKFHGREYSWGWAMVRWLRRDRDGRRWKPFLEFMKTASGGAPSDSENGRFLKAIGFKKDAALDEAWHAHLVLAGKKDPLVPLGASENALAEVAKIARPTAEQAATFFRFGESFARKGLGGPAVVYLRAAVRGGIEDPRLFLRLARMIAAVDGCTSDDPWPDESLDYLRRAVKTDPLRAATRCELGRQLLLIAESGDEIVAARNQLGLALLLAGPNDDIVYLATEALRGVMAADESLSARAARDWLVERAPNAKRSLLTAFHYFLQEEGLWEDLAKALEESVEKGEARFEDRKMLAGLYRAGDRLTDAAKIYAELLIENPKALYLWLPLVQCLAEAGETAAAMKAREKAIRTIDASREDHQALRERILAVPLK
jgi:hypothetical protein